MSPDLRLTEVARTPQDELAELGTVPVPAGEPAPAPPVRGVLWAAAAVLLQYPDEALLAALPDVRAALAQVAGQARDGEADAARLLASAVDALAGSDPLAAQQQYVATFDTRRRCCPYLTYYLHGDTRRRGLALWRVKAALRACGVEPAGGELPDHLSVLCELAATGDEQVAIALLTEHRVGLTLLASALRAGGGPDGADGPGARHAAVVAAVDALLPAAGPDLLQRAVRDAAAGPPSERVGLAGWTAPFLPDRDDRGARR